MTRTRFSPQYLGGYRGQIRKLGVNGQSRRFQMVGMSYIPQDKNSPASEIQRAAKVARDNGFYARIVEISKDKALLNTNNKPGARRWGLFLRPKKTPRKDWPVNDIDRQGRIVRLSRKATNQNGINQLLYDSRAKGLYTMDTANGTMVDYHHPKSTDPLARNRMLNPIKTEPYIQQAAFEGSLKDFNFRAPDDSGINIYNKRWSPDELLLTEELDAIARSTINDKQISDLTSGYLWIGGTTELGWRNRVGVSQWLQQKEGYDPTLNNRDNIESMFGERVYDATLANLDSLESSLEYYLQDTLYFPYLKGSDAPFWVRGRYHPGFIEHHPSRARTESFIGDSAKNIPQQMVSQLIRDSWQSTSPEHVRNKKYNPRYDQWIIWADKKRQISQDDKDIQYDKLIRLLQQGKYEFESHDVLTQTIDESIVNFLNDNNITDKSWREVTSKPDPTIGGGTVQGSSGWRADT